jgi:glucose/arabinose dehydrogenase
MYGQPAAGIPMPGQTDMAAMLQQLQSPMGMATQSQQQMPLTAQEQAMLMSLTQGGKQPVPPDQVNQIMQLLAMLQAQGGAGAAPGMMAPPGMGMAPPGMMPPPGMGMPPPPMM